MSFHKICFLTLVISATLFSKGMPKEYFEIKDRKKSKEYFFEYIYELSKNENKKILQERNFVKTILSSNILHIDTNSQSFLRLLEIKKKYRVKKLYDLTSYMKKIDTIPPALALAQAAVESGWGRSRFVKIANNIFGHWTYNPNIGIVPEQRDEDAKHLIRVFKSLQGSISAYMLNLNRNSAYKEFQEKRYQISLDNKQNIGLELSQTIVNYSGIGKEYLSILKMVIENNKLEQYDKRFYQQLK